MMADHDGERPILLAYLGNRGGLWSFGDLVGG